MQSSPFGDSAGAAISEMEQEFVHHYIPRRDAS